MPEETIASVVILLGNREAADVLLRDEKLPRFKPGTGCHAKRALCPHGGFLNFTQLRMSKNAFLTCGQQVALKLVTSWKQSCEVESATSFLAVILKIKK